MTTRLQVLRSSTTGNIPAAGTRLPGELWANFPDLQLGVIDASKNAQKLVAIRYFSVTANYAAGDFVVQASAIYAAKVAVTAGAFNAGQWTMIGSVNDLGAPYLPVAGGTLTGPLTLNADPGAALGAATKQYVDGKVTAAPFVPLAGGTMTGLLTLSGPPAAPLQAATKAYVDSGAFVPVAGGANTGLNDNRVINGDMRIDQRNNGSATNPGTGGVYTIDRWLYAGTQTAKFSVGRNYAAVASAVGFPYYLGFQSASAYALAASDYFIAQQTIEADMVSDFAWGTVTAQAVTLSFWAYSSLTGTFSGSIRNSPATRSYPFTFSLPTANVWTKIVLTIPGDSAGTWVMSGNAAGVQLNFDLGSGATFRAAAGAWAAGNYLGATGAVSVVTTNGATFYLTGVKLEIGSVATPFNRQSLTKSMADCQRYYQAPSYMMVGCYSAAATTNYFTVPLVTSMRANPTVVFNGQTYTNSSGLALNTARPEALTVALATTAAGVGYASFGFTAAAEL